MTLVWFGALTAVTLQTAYLSPPVAMSAYYLKQVVKDWSLGTIYNGMFQFMVLQVICIGLVVSFPQIALWFPQTLQAVAARRDPRGAPEDHRPAAQEPEVARGRRLGQVEAVAGAPTGFPSPLRGGARGGGTTTSDVP